MKRLVTAVLGLVLVSGLTFGMAASAKAEDTPSTPATSSVKGGHKVGVSKNAKTPKGWVKGKKKGFKGADEPKGVEKKEAATPTVKS